MLLLLGSQGQHNTLDGMLKNWNAAAYQHTYSSYGVSGILGHPLQLVYREYKKFRGYPRKQIPGVPPEFHFFTKSQGKVNSGGTPGIFQISFTFPYKIFFDFFFIIQFFKASFFKAKVNTIFLKEESTKIFIRKSQGIFL